MVFLLDKIFITTAQLRSLAHYSCQLVAFSSNSIWLGKVINLLENMALVQGANAAVKEHEAKQVKKELDKKKGWKKSQVQLKVSPNKTGRAWTRRKIDCALA